MGKSMVSCRFSLKPIHWFMGSASMSVVDSSLGSSQVPFPFKDSMLRRFQRQLQSRVGKKHIGSWGWVWPASWATSVVLQLIDEYIYIYIIYWYNMLIYIYIMLILNIYILLKFRVCYNNNDDYYFHFSKKILSWLLLLILLLLLLLLCIVIYI